jgi:hypothetical protein
MLCKFEPDSSSWSEVIKEGGILWNLQWRTVVEVLKIKVGDKICTTNFHANGTNNAWSK